MVWGAGWYMAARVTLDIASEQGFSAVLSQRQVWLVAE